MVPKTQLHIAFQIQFPELIQVCAPLTNADSATASLRPAARLSTTSKLVYANVLCSTGTTVGRFNWCGQGKVVEFVLTAFCELVGFFEIQDKFTFR